MIIYKLDMIMCEFDSIIYKLRTISFEILDSEKDQSVEEFFFYI